MVDEGLWETIVERPPTNGILGLSYMYPVGGGAEGSGTGILVVLNPSSNGMLGLS